MPATPSPAPIFELLNAFRRSKILFTFVRLGIPDILHQHGPADANQILEICINEGYVSSALNASSRANVAIPKEPLSSDGIERLCRAAISLGLLTQSSASSQPQKFALTSLSSAYLLSKSPTSLAGYVHHSDSVLYPLWDHLPSAVLLTHPSWKQAFDLPSSATFQALYQTSDDQLRFMKGMHSFASLSAPAVVKAFNLGWAKNVVDLGGGTGALAVEICRRWKDARATVVDLPAVVEMAKDHFLVHHSEMNGGVDLSVLERITTVGADFFADPDEVPEGDLFILSRILHDWPEDKCEVLLRNVHSKLVPGGALLVCEMLLEDGGVGPINTVCQDMNMLVQTGGRERTEKDYRALLERCGFQNVEGKKTGEYLDAVIGWKSHEL